MVCLALGVCPPAPVQADEVLIKAAKVTEMGSGFLKISIFGYVYKIDLFDGQVYVKTEGMPVWVNPK